MHGPFLCRSDGWKVDSVCHSPSQPSSQRVGSLHACVLSCSCLRINPSVTKGAQAFFTYQLFPRPKSSFQRFSRTRINYVWRESFIDADFFCFADDPSTVAAPLEKCVPAVLLLCLNFLSLCLLLAPSVLLLFSLGYLCFV